MSIQTNKPTTTMTTPQVTSTPMTVIKKDDLMLIPGCVRFPEGFYTSIAFMRGARDDAFREFMSYDRLVCRFIRYHMVLFDICDEIVTRYAIKYPKFYAKAVRRYENDVKNVIEYPVYSMVYYHLLKQQVGHTSQQRIKMNNNCKKLISTGTSSLPAKKFMLRQKLVNQVANQAVV
jgi:hypothetical protein